MSAASSWSLMFGVPIALSAWDFMAAHAVPLIGSDLTESAL